MRETLERSFADRMSHEKGAGNNLDNAWYAGGAPETTWSATKAIGAQGINIVTRIHERMTRIDPSGAAWEQVKYIRNLWWGGSGGFKVVYRDREGMRRRLHDLFDKVAEDLLIGALAHQKRSALRGLVHAKIEDLTSPAASPPDANTFREVDGLGREALHVCIAKTEPSPTTLDDIHLDWVSPVKGADPVHRRCVYGWTVGAPHWLQATMQIGKPVFPFGEIDEMIADTEERRARGEKPKRGSAAAWDDWLGRWRAKEWELAAAGKRGHDEAMRWRKACKALTSDWQRR